MEALRTTVAELQSAGRAKDAELRKLQELADSTQELYAGDAQAAKIIDLSKKVRALLLFAHVFFGAKLSATYTRARMHILEWFTEPGAAAECGEREAESCRAAGAAEGLSICTPSPTCAPGP